MRVAEILIVGGKEEHFVFLETALIGAALAGRVRWAKGRDEAIALFKGEGVYADRQAFPLPGLVFVDLRDRALEGFEVLWWLRRLPDLARVPTIVITRSRFSADLQWAYDAGASSFLADDYPADEFLKAVKAAVEFWSKGSGPAKGGGTAAV